MLFDIFKRTSDIVSSIFLLIIFSPVIIATSIAIKINSPGPILADVGKRSGRYGRLFKFYKFRSMIENAHNLIKSDPKLKKVLKERESGGVYKIKKDPRITSVGRFIRKYSIDEIPQLMNVFKGEMSVVGPRPYYSDELKLQEKKYPDTKKFIREMHTVRPGITGYWQVAGRSDVAFDKRIEMDAYYARKRSIILDILILIKTPWVMVTGQGAG